MTRAVVPTPSSAPLLLALLLPMLLASACAAPAPQLRLLQTSSGAFAGVQTRTGPAWLGIPYAAPPTGDHRWREPEPPESRMGVRPANAWPAAIDPEDCLRLDLWLPPTDTGAAALPPLLVWLREEPHDTERALERPGGRFAERGVAIAQVYLRPRLLGVFAHPALEQQRPGGPADFALRDAVAALRWLHDNAGQIGVDPARVTVAAEGRAGLTALLLWCTDDARGLLQRIALHDVDGLVELAAPPAARDEGRRLLQVAGLLPATTAADLRSLPAVDLLRVDPGRGPLGLPVQDGALVPAQPWQRLVRGDEAPVPLLVGSTDRGDADDDRRAATARGLAALHSQRAPVFLFRNVATGAAASVGLEDMLFAAPARASATDAEAQRRWLTDHVQNYWTAFARAETPTSRSGPAWPPYRPQPDGDVTLRFGAAIEAVTGLDRDRLDRLLDRFARDVLQR